MSRAQIALPAVYDFAILISRYQPRWFLVRSKGEDPLRHTLESTPEKARRQEHLRQIASALRVNHVVNPWPQLPVHVVKGCNLRSLLQRQVDFVEPFKQSFASPGRNRESDLLPARRG